MIMKIRQLENECDSLEKEVYRKSKDIEEKLRREKDDKDNDDLDHQEEVSSIITGNQVFKEDLSKYLSTLKWQQQNQS
jgi:hypothetical protein